MITCIQNINTPHPHTRTSFHRLHTHTLSHTTCKSPWNDTSWLVTHTHGPKGFYIPTDYYCLAVWSHFFWYGKSMCPWVYWNSWLIVRCMEYEFWCWRDMCFTRSSPDTWICKATCSENAYLLIHSQWHASAWGLHRTLHLGSFISLASNSSMSLSPMDPWIWLWSLWIYGSLYFYVSLPSYALNSTVPRLGRVDLPDLHHDAHHPFPSRLVGHGRPT